MEDIAKPQFEDGTNDGFNAREFLDEFRQTMVKTGQVINGPIKAAHKEELSVLLPDAEIVAREQTERTKRILPADTPDSFVELEEPYIAGFTRVVRGMGISALRLADKGNAQFAAVLRDPERRQKVYKSLSTDFRLLAWHLEGESTDDFKASVLKQYAVLYQHGNSYKELKRDFSNFSPIDLRAAVLGRLRNPRGFLEFATTKIQELAALPAYEDMPPSTIKHAVFSFTSNPEGYLDNIIATIEELSAEPQYADFGLRAIRYVANTYTKTSPRTALDKAIVKAEELRKDHRYKDISTALLKNAVLTSPDSVDDTLKNAVKTIASLKENPRLDIFGAADLTQAVLFHPKNTEKFLEDARQLFDDLRVDSKYDEIGDGYIKDAVLSRTENPRKFLDFAVEKIDQLLADPKYSVFGKGHITDAVIKRTTTTEAYLDGILEQVADYQANPTFAAIEATTIRYFLISKPTEADEILRKIASGENYPWRRGPR